jgi:hypothetical protein
VDAPLAYFGLGSTENLGPLTLRIIWADGTTANFSEVPANRLITILEGQPAFRATALSGREP